MRWILLLLALTGCGPVIVTPRQQEMAAQALSDNVAALNYVMENPEVPTQAKWAAYDSAQHAYNIARAMEIDFSELPRARVTTDDWKANPEKAHAISTSNTGKDSNDMIDLGWKVLAGAGITALAVRAGQLALGNSPLGPIFNTLNGLIGGANPKRKRVYDKMLKALDEYKALDPEWRSNKLYMLLSDKFTNPEKDFIKNERHDL